MFRIGSITKSFIALTALRLIERGELDLQEAVHDFIPEAGVENRWRTTQPVRLVHLLEHTAGFDDLHVRDFAIDGQHMTTLEGIQANTSSRIVRWPPGTRMSYSNIGTAVAALFLEKRTGLSIEALVKQEVFDVLDMHDISFFDDARVSKGYWPNGVPKEYPYSHITTRAAGSINATAGSMAALLDMFLQDGGDLLSEASIARMESPTSTYAAKAGLRIGYGLANMRSEGDGVLWQWHNGGIDGFYSVYSYNRDLDVGYFYSVNAPLSIAGEKIYRAMQGFLLRGKVKLAPLPAYKHPALSQFVGYYEPDTSRQELNRCFDLLLGSFRLSVQQKMLVAHPLFGDAIRFVPVSDNLFRSIDGNVASAAAVQNDAGDLLLQSSLGNYRKVTRSTIWTRWITTGAVLVIWLSGFLYALWWGVRKLAGRMRDISVTTRAIPVVAVLLALLCVAVLIMTGPFALEALGVRSSWSVTYWLASWLFAVVSALGAIRLLRTVSKIKQEGVLVWSHALLMTMANLIVVLYLWQYGWIGLRLWVY